MQAFGRDRWPSDVPQQPLGVQLYVATPEERGWLDAWERGLGERDAIVMHPTDWGRVGVGECDVVDRRVKPFLSWPLDLHRSRPRR
jgi:hypothetical protein